MAILNTTGFIYRSFWTHLSLFALLAGPLLLAVGIAANQRLAKRTKSRIWDWSPFGVRGNITLLPLTTKFFAIWVILLAIIIPIVALLEELIFRVSAHGVIQSILWGGVVFGFAHLTSLVRVRMCVYLTGIGLLFVLVYHLWGLWAVWTLHVSYNLTALALATAESQGLTKRVRVNG